MYKKLNSFFNISKDVLVAHCYFPCLASIVVLFSRISIKINKKLIKIESFLHETDIEFYRTNTSGKICKLYVYHIRFRNTLLKI